MGYKAAHTCVIFLAGGNDRGRFARQTAVLDGISIKGVHSRRRPIYIFQCSCINEPKFVRTDSNDIPVLLVKFLDFLDHGALMKHENIRETGGRPRPRARKAREWMETEIKDEDCDVVLHHL